MYLEYAVYNQTETFTTLELQNPRHVVAELHKFLRSPDLEALQLCIRTHLIID